MQYKISQKFAPQCLAQIHLKIETNTFHWNLQHFHFLETLSLSHKLDCFLAFQIFSICFSLLARILQMTFHNSHISSIFPLQKFLFFNWLEFVFFRVFQKNQTRIVFSVVGLDWIGGTFCWRLNRDIFTQTYSNTTGRISVGFYIFVGVHLCIVLIFEYL